MFRFRHKTLIMISGMIWLAIGVFLMNLGLHFIVESIEKGRSVSSSNVPLLSLISGWTGVEEAAMCIVGLALLIGFFKGRYVLSKSVNRLVSRIKNLPEPTSIFSMYSGPYYALMACMMLLGMGMRYFAVPQDVRGLVDVAVGAALINGSMLYFRIAVTKPQITTNN